MPGHYLTCRRGKPNTQCDLAAGLMLLLSPLGCGAHAAMHRQANRHTHSNSMARRPLVASSMQVPHWLSCCAVPPATLRTQHACRTQHLSSHAATRGPSGRHSAPALVRCHTAYSNCSARRLPCCATLLPPPAACCCPVQLRTGWHCRRWSISAGTEAWPLPCPQRQAPWCPHTPPHRSCSGARRAG